LVEGILFLEIIARDMIHQTLDLLFTFQLEPIKEQITDTYIER